MKKLIAIALSVMLATSIAACGTKTAQNTSTTPISSETPDKKGDAVEIVYLNSHGDVWEGDIGQEIFSKFESSHPNIKVKAESYPFDQMLELVEVKMKSNSSDFDAFNVDAPLVASYTLRGYLDPFQNYMTREAIEKTFTKTAIKAASYGGVLMTAPKKDSGMVMVYNKTILQENGISFPENDVNNRMTWEDLLELAKRATKVTNGTTEIWGIVPDQINRAWNIMPLANSLGTTWLSEDGMTATGFLNSEASIKAMKFYQSWFNEYGVSPKGVNTNEARELFDTGKVAFIFGDPVCYARASKKGIDVGIMPVPAFEGGVPAVGADSWHVGINANSKHKEEAAEFIKYITFEEGSDIFLDSQSNIGCRIDRIKEITAPSHPNSELYSLLSYELENNAFGRPKTPGYNEWSDVVDSAIEDIRNGADVKSTLDAASSKLDGILAKYKK